MTESDDFLLFVVIGFGAQLVDGAIGMAYGVTATSVLLSFGITPMAASASVHAAEIFTTAASGIAHWRIRNIDWSVVRNLLVPGVAGGTIGAYLLTRAPSDLVTPAVSIYLFVLGGMILLKAWRQRPQAGGMSRSAMRILGLVGGFLDAVGGGGWGPVVTSTLIGRGTVPRYAIGSVNITEFFVSASIAGTFVGTIGLELWPVIAGLIAGGVLAAPMSAFITRALPGRLLMMFVGLIVMTLSARALLLPIRGPLE
jgi:uncharacterized membrane protein YfcA